MSSNYDDLDPAPKYFLEQSDALADQMSEQAQQLAATPRAETGNSELNAQLDEFLLRLGGFMQDSAHGARASNRHVADLARAEQAQQSEQDSTEQDS